MINNYDVAVLSEKVAYLENALKTAGVLPEVSATDNGATLQVVEGVWGVGNPIPGVVNALDSTSSTDALSAAQGKALNESKASITYEDVRVTTGSDLYNGWYYAGTNLTDSAHIIGVTVYKDNVNNDPAIAQITSTGALRVYTHTASQTITVRIIRSQEITVVN